MLSQPTVKEDGTMTKSALDSGVDCSGLFLNPRSEPEVVVADPKEVIPFQGLDPNSLGKGFFMRRAFKVIIGEDEMKNIRFTSMAICGILVRFVGWEVSLVGEDIRINGWYDPACHKGVYVHGEEVLCPVPHEAPFTMCPILAMA